MEDSKKKRIMIGVVVVCFVAAGVIWYATRPADTGIGSIKRGTMFWVKCNEPKCGAEYQIDSKDYYEYVQKHQKGMGPPPLICKECGKKKAYRAEKCEKDGTVFFYSSIPGDFPDRCPKCGYSKTEEQIKQAREARRSR